MRRSSVKRLSNCERASEKMLPDPLIDTVIFIIVCREIWDVYRAYILELQIPLLIVATSFDRFKYFTVIYIVYVALIENRFIILFFVIRNYLLVHFIVNPDESTVIE